MLLALLLIDAYFRSLAHRMRYKTKAFNPIFVSQADFDPLSSRQHNRDIPSAAIASVKKSTV